MDYNEENKPFHFGPEVECYLALESTFKAKLRKELESMFPGCVILKNDAELQGGIPDMLILWRTKWAMLEVKKKPPAASDYEPNQEWWIQTLDDMSFAACIFPENKEEVIDALQQAFWTSR